MSEPKLISPMLDNFSMGGPISEHHGVRCCPAMNNDNGDKHIVKVISIPATQTQLDALLLTGAYSDLESAAVYFKELADGVVEEAQILQSLAQLEGFLTYDSWQIVPMEDNGEVGYDVYLLSDYRRSLDSHMRKQPITHLAAVNLGLDLCAALAVCRRSGYMYVDLKPSNIFVTSDQEYRIGDLGFVKLSSMKYASLPDKYRSDFTAPEICDAFASLNETIDTYALGMILYTIFNDGKLPVEDPENPGQFCAPVYADYEMSEIILKAIDTNPENRWQNPVQMGQELVAYMQRNGANDTPIVPLPVAAPDEHIDDAEVRETNDIPEEISDNTELSEVEQEQAEAQNDGFENLSFLTNDSDDETAPGNDGTEVNYDEVSDEVSDILAQVDELIEHPTPDPVVAPEPIDVPMPEPIQIEEVEEKEESPAEAEESAEDQIHAADEEASSEEESEEKESEEEATEEDVVPATLPEDCESIEAQSNTEDSQDAAAEDTGEEAQDELDEELEELPPKKKSHWLRNTVLVLLILLLLAAGVYCYKEFYCLPIDTLTLDGKENELTVLVDTKVDTSTLTVVCSDAYGNKTEAPIVDGKVFFTGLTPNTSYNVKVVTSGFHRVTGKFEDTYTTPAQTNVTQFQALTGSSDGSIIINITVEGPEPQVWTLLYSISGEEEKQITFNEHTVSLNDLLVGSSYTFKLAGTEETYLTGSKEIVHTVLPVIKPVDLQVISRMDGKITATWSTPAETNVESWIVRCYNSSGYDESKTVNNTTVTFDNISETGDYTLEVKAGGMSEGKEVTVDDKSVTITELTADTSNPSAIKLTWNANEFTPAEGWKISCSINDCMPFAVGTVKENAAVIKTILPGAKHKFFIEADGVTLLGGNYVYTAPAAETFSGYGVTANNMSLRMCKTPSVSDWDRTDLRSSDYTNTFSSGTKASFLARLHTSYNTSSDDIITVYVIKDADGNVVSASTQTRTWRAMWYNGYCELDIPSIPSDPGKYSVSIYFNSGFVYQQEFTVS